MKLRTIIILLSIILLLAFIKIVVLKDDTKAEKKSMPPSAQVANVTGYIASSQLLENKVYATGSILANEEVVLHPEVSGKLTQIYFKEGNIVQKGAMLAKINDADLQAQLKRLGFQLKLATEKSNRLRGLLQIQGVSQQEFDEGASQLNLIQADMDYTRAQIQKTEIRAPFTGKIGLRQVSAGSFVTNSTTIATIQKLNVLKIDFSVPEKYSEAIHIGDMIQFTIDNSTKKSFAKVYAIEPKIDAQTRNMMIRAICENPEAGTLPGAFARVEMITNKNSSSIMIPTEAIIPELKGKKVFLYKGGKSEPSNVETGIRNDAKIEILQGVNEGDTVIVTGIMSLKPGASIKIIELKK